MISPLWKGKKHQSVPFTFPRCSATQQSSQFAHPNRDACAGASYGRHPESRSQFLEQKSKFQFWNGTLFPIQLTFSARAAAISRRRSSSAKCAWSNNKSFLITFQFHFECAQKLLIALIFSYRMHVLVETMQQGERLRAELAGNHWGWRPENRRFNVMNGGNWCLRKGEIKRIKMNFSKNNSIKFLYRKWFRRRFALLRLQIIFHFASHLCVFFGPENVIILVNFYLKI